jgi:hypothetical protein
MSSNLHLIAKLKWSKSNKDVYALISVSVPEEIALSDNWPSEVDFYSNLTGYEVSGKDKKYEGEVDPSWQNPTPMGAYIHSGISFYRGSGKVDQWDSGLAGYLVGPDKEEVESAANMMCAYPEFETRVWVQLSVTADDLIRHNFVEQEQVFIEKYFTLASYGSERLRNIKELEEFLKTEYFNEEEGKSFEWINTDGV